MAVVKAKSSMTILKTKTLQHPPKFSTDRGSFAKAITELEFGSNATDLICISNYLTSFGLFSI